MKAMLPNNPNKNSCDKCGYELKQRIDDNEETIKKRLDIFKDASEPLFDYYKEKGVLVSIEPKKGIKDYYKIKNIVFNNLNINIETIKDKQYIY